MEQTKLNPANDCQNSVEKELEILQKLLEQIYQHCNSFSNKLEYICKYPLPEAQSEKNEKVRERAYSPLLEKISNLQERAKIIINYLEKLNDKIGL